MNKKMIDIMLAVLTLLTLSAGVAIGEDSLRVKLLSGNGVKLLYPVDEFHTFIAGAPDVTDLEKSGAVIVNRYFDASGEDRFKAYLIKHNTPQPLVYKSPVVHEDTTSLPSSVKLVGETFDGEKSGLSALDLYEQMNIICRAKKGVPAYVITKRYGDFKRLTKVSAPEAFSYILLAENTGDAWLMACEGKEKFLVEKNYRVINGGADGADIYPGTALEGVSYVENSPYAEDLFAQRARKEASPAEKAAFMKDLARSIAATKMAFVRPYKGVRYAGTYNEKEGCGMVSIRRSEDVMADSRTVISEFSVCSGEVASAGERVIKETVAAKRISLSPGNPIVITKKDENR